MAGTDHLGSLRDPRHLQATWGQQGGKVSSEAIAKRAIGPPEGVERPVNTVTFQPPGGWAWWPGYIRVNIYIRVGGAAVRRGGRLRQLPDHRTST